MLIGALALMLGACSSGDPEPAPLVDVDALHSRLEASRDAATLLVFWATWCEPCVEEIAVLRQLHDDTELNLRILSVSLDSFLEGPEGGRQLVLDFLQKNPVPWEQLVYDGSQDALFEPFQMSGMIPFSILYDESGNELRRFRGRFQASQVHAVLATARL
jgi:thiol-disulfide isomerase/thioredoxin